MRRLFFRMGMVMLGLFIAGQNLYSLPLQRPLKPKPVKLPEVRQQCTTTSTPIITTIAGNGQRGFSSDGGPAIDAELFDPQGVAVDAQGNIYIGDDQRIRKVTPDGIIHTIAGNGQYGFSGDGGPAINAEFGDSKGVAVDTQGNIYIADSPNKRIRKVTPDGIIHTIAGNGQSGFSGDGGPAINAEFKDPIGVAVDTQGNIYIADGNNRRIRKVTPDGIIHTVAGNGAPAGPSEVESGPAINISLGFVEHIAVDTQGNIYIEDSWYETLKVTPDGITHKIAGNGLGGFSGDGGSAIDATVGPVRGIAVDIQGNIYIADDQRVRQVTPDGIIHTVAGNGLNGFSGDGGPAIDAEFKYPQGIAVDAQGNIYIADIANHRIRKVTQKVTTVCQAPKPKPAPTKNTKVSPAPSKAKLVPATPPSP